MSRQGTLTSFLKVSAKRSISSSPVSNEKRIKLSPTKGFDEKICETEEFKINSPKPKNSSQSLQGFKKKPPHELRKELIAFSQKYPIINKNIGLSWYSALASEFEKPYFSELNEFVMSQRSSRTVYPPENNVWTWTTACKMEDVKVVILGQDPYHNPGQAHGLCFSVQIGVPPPPSLLNMYKEMESDIEGFVRPKHGYLNGWAKQGVLLLNAVLTVAVNSPNSHKDKGWENLTTAVIKYLNDKFEGIVFLLWGSYAQKKADFVDKKKHLVLKSAHPSPLSASRGFFGCQHFSKCNEYLSKIGKKPIDWNNLPVD